MKREVLLSVVLILTFSSFSVLAQIEDGYFERKTGNSTEVGFYENAKKEGSWVKQTSQGVLSQLTTYKAGIRNGSSLTFDRKGNITKQEFYKDGKLHGFIITYHEASKSSSNTTAGNKPSSKTNYVDGIIEGKKILYYENGRIMEESNYSAGLKDGIAKWFNDKGKLVAENQYSNGVFNGTNKVYHENGNVKKEEQYVNNKHEGAYKEYYPTGKIKVMGTYTNDKKNGTWTEYATNGSESKRVEYVDGVVQEK